MFVLHPADNRQARVLDVDVAIIHDAPLIAWVGGTHAWSKEVVRKAMRQSILDVLVEVWHVNEDHALYADEDLQEGRLVRLPLLLRPTEVS